jgi:hypothetical protein
MKRYLVLKIDYDARPNHLAIPTGDDVPPDTRRLLLRNQQAIREQLMSEYGILNSDQKLQNFCDAGLALPSVLAFHNNFMRQIRNSFVVGAYYPALTGACALGERILNHLLLSLREFHRSTPEFKRVFNKESFDDWDIPIDTLTAWNVLLPDVATDFKDLKEQRHQALHFNPATDHNDRELALRAILTLSRIIDNQFGALEPKLWFISGNVGFSFIKREYEDIPFVKMVYVPNSIRVGPKHRLDSRGGQMVVLDDDGYEDKEITDDEFIRLYQQAKEDYFKSGAMIRSQ